MRIKNPLLKLPITSSVFEDQATQIVDLKVVLPTGEIIPTGTGAVTTAAGDFSRRFFPADLTGLFLGSEGAFGVITERSRMAEIQMRKYFSGFLLLLFLGVATAHAADPCLPAGDWLPKGMDHLRQRTYDKALAALDTAVARAPNANRSLFHWISI